MTHEVDLAAAPRGALAPLALRFTLDPAAKYGIFDRDRQQALDGAWWPRSRDAAPELIALAAGLTALFGKIIRLAVDRTDFDDIPHKITVNGRVIRVGWFDNLNHIVIVTRGRQDEFLLLVIPPHTPPAAAAAALASAASATGSGRPQLEPDIDRWADDGAPQHTEPSPT